MKSVRGFAVGLAALALIVCLTPGVANAANNQVTVGDFLTAYARALNIELPASAGSDALVESLRAAGVKLDASLDLAKPLTQGDVVKIGKANGLRVSSRNPEAEFTSDELSQFFTAYGPALSQGSLGDEDTRFAASDNPPGDPASKARTDRGKKKGRPFQSPSEPE